MFSDLGFTLYFLWGIWIIVVIAIVAIAKHLRKKVNKYQIYIDQEGLICPYCQGEFSGGEVAIRCPQCSTPHHVDCWRENGGCGVFGCWARSRRWKKAGPP